MHYNYSFLFLYLSFMFKTLEFIIHISQILLIHSIATILSSKLQLKCCDWNIYDIFTIRIIILLTLMKRKYTKCFFFILDCFSFDFYPITIFWKIRKKETVFHVEKRFSFHLLCFRICEWMQLLMNNIKYVEGCSLTYMFNINCIFFPHQRNVITIKTLLTQVLYYCSFKTLWMKES